MKQWEMDLYTAILNNDMQDQRETSLQIVRSHTQFETPIPQSKADQMFEHVFANENMDCLTFLKKTNFPSLPVLKLCIKTAIGRNVVSSVVWNWVAEELKRWQLNPAEIKSLIKPMRLIESALHCSMVPAMSYHCTRTLRPYLQQKEIDQLTLFAHSSFHFRASRELLKYANLDEIKKLSHTYYNPNDAEFDQLHQQIEEERSKRTKKVLEKHVKTTAVNAKRKI